MTANKDLHQDAFFDSILILGKTLGLSRSVATIFAILYSHEGSLSIEELVVGSGLSKSAVSLALRDLAQLGAVQEKAHIGERSRRYSGQSDLTQVVTNIVVARLKYPLSELRDKLENSSGSEARRKQVRVLLDTFDHTVARISTEQY